MLPGVGAKGRRWAVLRRYDIPDLVDRSATYLTRWRLVETPWFGVYLHAIRLPDRDPHPHDHPWPFVVVMLKGGYTEEYHDGLPAAVEAVSGGGGRTRRWRAGHVRFVPTTVFHSITGLDWSPTFTLMLVGRRRHEWGYATPSGWVHHERYRVRIGAE